MHKLTPSQPEFVPKSDASRRTTSCHPRIMGKNVCVFDRRKLPSADGTEQTPPRPSSVGEDKLGDIRRASPSVPALFVGSVELVSSAACQCRSVYVHNAQ